MNNYSAPRSPRFRSLTRQLNLLEMNLESAVLSYKGLGAESLARERIEKELEKERNEKEIVFKKLVEMTEKHANVSGEFRRVKQETEEQILFLREKCRKLEERQELREEEIIKLIEKIEQMNDFHQKFQEKQAEEIKKLSSENNSLEKAQFQLKTELTLLQEKLLNNENAEGREKGKDLTSAAPNLDKITTVETENKEQKEIKLLSPSDRKSFPKRFLEWWSEPVATVSFSPISF